MVDIRSSGRQTDHPAIERPVNLNMASFEELRAVPGIGASRANQIVQWREQKGPFQAIEELQHVPDFTPEVMTQIREHLRV